MILPHCENSLALNIGRCHALKVILLWIDRARFLSLRQNAENGLSSRWLLQSLCMMTYAIIGSSEVHATITFITSVINRLRMNLYPIRVLQQMWSAIVTSGMLKQLPCHTRIHRKINVITREVSKHINRLQ
jgi:hypothetical protein